MYRVIKIVKLYTIYIIGNGANGGFISNGIPFASMWALTTLQCVISGTAIIITPTMYIGQLLGISSDNAILSYAIDQLPHTADRHLHLRFQEQQF